MDDPRHLVPQFHLLIQIALLSQHHSLKDSRFLSADLIQDPFETLPGIEQKLSISGMKR